jgi:hypothetical protein
MTTLQPQKKYKMTLPNSYTRNRKRNKTLFDVTIGGVSNHSKSLRRYYHGYFPFVETSKGNPR